MRVCYIAHEYVIFEMKLVLACDVHRRVIPYEPPHDKTNKMICAPSEDSDQLGQCAQWVAEDPIYLHADNQV